MIVLDTARRKIDVSYSPEGWIMLSIFNDSEGVGNWITNSIYLQTDEFNLVVTQVDKSKTAWEEFMKAEIIGDKENDYPL